MSLYERAFQIGEMALPVSHPKLVWYHNDMGIVCNKKVGYIKALSFHQRAVEVRKGSLPATHPHRKLYRDNVEDIQRKLERLSYFTK